MIKVSIITPLFNKGPYVDETIRSVLAQTLSDWEMIVVENGSTDEGPEVVRRFSDPRITLVASPKRGPGAARNFGLGRATGEWILFLDADDLIDPNYLNDRLTSAKASPVADLLVGPWMEFIGNQTKGVLHKPANFGHPANIVGQSAIAHAPWALHAALIRRSRLTSELEWPEELDNQPSEDTAFWFPVVHGATIAWSGQCGARYRVQMAGSRNDMVDTLQWFRAVVGVIEYNVEFLRRRGDSPDAAQYVSIFRVLESIYRLALANNSRKAAQLALCESTAWLAKCPTSSPGILMRKCLGLQFFNLVRHGVI